MRHRTSWLAGAAAALTALCAAVLLLVAPSAGAATATSTAQAGQPKPTPVVTVSVPPLSHASAVAGAAATSLTCDDPYVLSYNRTQACSPGALGVVWYLKGAVVGKTTVDLLGEYQLNYKSRDFSEKIKVVKVTAVGFYRPLSMDFSASCGSPCKATTHWPQGSLVSAGLHGSVSFHDSIGAGKRHTTSVNYVALVTPAGYGPLRITFGSPLSFRCDDMLAFQGAGCVFPAYTPTLSLSRSIFGASAAMVQWAQQNLSGHWGLKGSGKPLTRLANSAASDRNRTIICARAWSGEGSRIGGDFGDTDSCDEFPFAATYQSGARHGVTSGGQCAQVTAVETGTKGQTEAQRWNSVQPLGTHSSTAACVRGHIPLRLNNGVGNAYRVFIGPERLLDSDGFWVAVTG